MMKPSPAATIAENESTFSDFLGRAAKTLASATGPGFVAGLVAEGFGSRLAMRIMALTSSDAVQGVRTEAEAVVGEITVGGTVFLLLFGGVIGAAGGVIYLAIRRWLPGRGWRQGLVLGVVALAATGRLLVAPDNLDFAILDPAALAVAMFLALPLLYGPLFVPLHERAWRYLHGERTRAKTALTLVSILPLVAFFPLAFVVTASILVLYGLQQGPAFWRTPTFTTTGYIALATATAFGLALVTKGVLEIL